MEGLAAALAGNRWSPALKTFLVAALLATNKLLSTTARKNL
jgi:hypothetical protein